MKTLLWVLGGVLAAAPALAAQQTAITGVTVVDTRAGTIRPNQTVLVGDGRIQSVETGRAAPAGATVIDGRGRFLIPGLWDMHVHLRDAAAPAVLLPQFVANGVTGVRDMASDCDGPKRPGQVCADDLLEWRARIEAGTMLGPRLLALSSFIINPPWDYQVTEEQARGVVRTAKSRGLDLLKIYFRLSPQAFGWIMDEARQVGIKAAGHIPLRVTAVEASTAGLWSLEHARDFLFDCFPGAAEFRRTARSQNPPPDVFRAMVERHDPGLCDPIFATFVRNGTAYVPTHVTRRMDAFADDSAFRNDRRSIYIPAAAWKAWNEDADRMVALDTSAAGRRVVRGFYEKGLAITARAHAAGVAVVLGTDAGDSYVFPGSGVHDELGELVKAGLTPGQALAAATTTAAAFLGREAEFGSVEPGKHADLVLLGANPLTDIANVRRIEGVMVGGRYHDRAALDAMLAGVAAEIAKGRP